MIAGSGSSVCSPRVLAAFRTVRQNLIVCVIVLVAVASSSAVQSQTGQSKVSHSAAKGGAPDLTVKAAQVPAASAAQRQPESTMVNESNRLPFTPTFLPKEVELTTQQVEAVRAASVGHITTYHEALTEQNRAAAASNELLVLNAKRSAESDASTAPRGRPW